MKLIRRLAGAGRRGSAREIQEIAGHEIERQLGRGGFGAVYLVRDRQTGERMALKIMLAQALVDENARKRFLREIETMRLLRHPHIVRLRTSGAVGDFFYFTMEYCPGGSLAAYMQQRGRRPLREAGPIMLEALDGLAAAHAAGIVHRDVKPANLLLAGPSAPWITKVGDLGLSRKFTEAGFSGLTATGTRGGDLLYMPREQLLHFHQVRPASDVWAAGATFYILLTGRHPRQTPPGQRLDPLRLVLEGETVPIRQVEPGLPEGVADVLDRALHPEPEARYQSAGEMRRALAAALA
jgi:serine/threonine protein kinase